MFQMKYSIIAQEITKENPFVDSKQYRRFFSNYQSTCIVSVNQDSRLKLHLYQNSNKSLEQQVPKKEGGQPVKAAEVALLEELDWKQLKSVWEHEEDWVLIFQRPLRIYFVLDKYKAIVPINLDQEIALEEMSCYISFPDLFVYGHSSQPFKNSLYNINLQTFEVKEITSNKDYSPKGRSNCWSFFSDSRLYVAGGFDKLKKKIDSLLWTLNIENGYWFALDLVHEKGRLSSECLSCQFQNGKVLIISKDQMSIAELYQSQVKEVEGWRDFISPQELSSAEQIFIWQQWVYIVCAGVLFPRKFKITKTKVIV